jgi:transcriptional regulator with XRE-family HTH domain
VHGWELSSRRRSAGLTLRQVARAAGTSESNVSAYERGAKTPSPRTLRRITAAIDAGGASPVHANTLFTMPAAAATIRRGLRRGWPTADLLRVVRELRSNAGSLVSRADRDAYFAEPSTTGDQRWDAMLAGSAEDLALRDGLEVPEWTRGHALPTFWFVGSGPALQAYAFARTPMSMQVRGVMVDPADLEAV